MPLSSIRFYSLCIRVSFFLFSVFILSMIWAISFLLLLPKYSAWYFTGSRALFNVKRSDFKDVFDYFFVDDYASLDIFTSRSISAADLADFCLSLSLDSLIPESLFSGRLSNLTCDRALLSLEYGVVSKILWSFLFIVSRLFSNYSNVCCQLGILLCLTFVTLLTNVPP